MLFEKQEYQQCCIHKIINSLKNFDFKNPSSSQFTNLAIEYSRSHKKQIDVLIKGNPKNSYAHNNLGVAYHKLEQYNDAIKSYKEAIALDSTLLKHANKQNWDALENWANSLTDTNQQKTPCKCYDN